MQDLVHSDYIFTVILFIMILIGFLLYLLVHYKKKLNKQKIQLLEKDEKIKSLRQYLSDIELKKVEREHELEKEIMTLSYRINVLETSKKEGLKSYVVNMIETYEKKRAQELERANIRR